MASWGVAQAKAKFSEVVEQAKTKGPQEITKGGKPVAVLIGIDQWKQWQRDERPKESLIEFFRRSPAYGLDFEIKRIALNPRKVEL
jgi:prevent-host-death family protein